MPSPHLAPTDAGSYQPPDGPPSHPSRRATDDEPSADDVNGTVRVVRWLWGKHVVTAALALIAGYRLRPEPDVHAVTAAPALDVAALQQSLAAHLASADSAQRTDVRAREATDDKLGRLERKVDALTRVACVALGTRERELVTECASVHLAGPLPVPPSLRTASAP